MRLYVMVVATITLFGVTAHAAEISISMAKETWPAGRRIEFSLVAVQADPDAPPDELSDHLACTLESGGKTHVVTARRVPGDDVSAAGGMTGVEKILYAFDPPDGIIGTVQLRIADVRVPAVLFEVVTPEKKAPSDSRYPTLDSLFTLYQPYLGDIAAYQPMYFLVGTDPSKSKFQISLKYRFFNPESDFVGRHPWVNGFHFGYTQTSFWDLKSSSAPFDDTSYKPELFWISKNLVSSDSSVRGLFLQSGFQHESNGRGGDTSRSTNFLYFQPVFVYFSESSQYGLQVAPKIWTYVNNDNDTNPDLADYRGYFDLDIKLGKAESFVLGSSFRWAEEGASVQLDLTYPLHRFFNALDIYIHAQYANTLAESLIDYRDRTHAVRLGFSIVR
ncbi:MAG: phospholipase A [Deltaproteobacteria bacterium]|nr:phospholipase A [Deltaproteobacteria bacterium]